METSNGTSHSISDFKLANDWQVTPLHTNGPEGIPGGTGGQLSEAPWEVCQPKASAALLASTLDANPGFRVCKETFREKGLQFLMHNESGTMQTGFKAKL
jgi:hypothetical protein